MSTHLDNHRIAIRERNLAEIMDLGLQVVRTLGFPLLGAVAIGAAPMIALNAWLLSELDLFVFLDEPEMVSEYVLAVIVFSLIEMPLAMAPATLYLGQSMFEDRPRWRLIGKELWRSLPQMLVLRVVPRAVLFWLAMVAMDEADAGILVLWLLALAIPSCGWPYLSEIILLERNPMFAGKPKRLTTRRRSRMLHSGAIGDLFGRWLGVLLVGSLLAAIAWWTLGWAAGMLMGAELDITTSCSVALPIALWIVIGYFTVVRFLCYLDLRIRREGWEVELALRAEAAKVAAQVI